MPHVPTNPALPFSGSTVTSRHCSAQAAITAAETRIAKSEQYLDWLLRVGCATDHTAHDHFGWPMGSVCSIRNGLFNRGLISVHKTEIGPHGSRCTLWRASDLARKQAAERARNTRTAGAA